MSDWGHDMRGWFRAAWTATAGAVAFAAVGALAAENARVVQDPYYREALYYSFQDRYFLALRDLTVAPEFDRVPHRDNEAELLRGSLLHAYGAQRDAERIFSRLVESEAKPSVRDQAWYHLAEIDYQRGQIAEAEQAIRRVGSDLPAHLDDGKLLLQAQLRMARGDYDGAEGILARISLSASAAALYVKHNLGVLLMKSGRPELGVALLDGVGTAAVDSDELLSLRDKANVALGYAALQAHDPVAARKYLERVRLSGVYANKALLGFGWALLSMEQAKEALVPWHELAQRPGADPAILEARLALPYALGQLGANAESLDRYNDAISSFLRESARLDESIAAIRRGDLLDDLLLLNPSDETGWFWTIARLPRLPHARHVAQLMAESEFQVAFKDYRELHFLADNLKQWASSMDALRGTLASRRQSFASTLPRIRSFERAKAVADIAAQRDAVATELKRAEAEGDVAALADARERKLRALVDRARAISSRGDGAEFDNLRERVRRLAGALIWKEAQGFGERLDEAQAALHGVNVELDAAAARSAALDKVQDGIETRLDDADRRVDLQSRRIHALEQRVDEQLRLQQSHVQKLATAALETQKERLATYLMQARFAVAQIYDRAGRAKESNHGVPH